MQLAGPYRRRLNYIMLRIFLLIYRPIYKNKEKSHAIDLHTLGFDPTIELI
jgi:hypothetical protein